MTSSLGQCPIPLLFFFQLAHVVGRTQLDRLCQLFRSRFDLQERSYFGQFVRGVLQHVFIAKEQETNAALA